MNRKSIVFPFGAWVSTGTVSAIGRLLFLSCLLLSVFSGCGKQQGTESGRKADADTLDVLASHISACSRLYTSQYDLRKVMIYTDTTTINGNFLSQHIRVAVPFSDRKIAIPITATAKAYVDLGKVKKDDIVRQGDKLEIILPDPEITLTSTSIDHKSVKQKVGLLRHRFTDDETTRIQQEGRADLIKSLTQTNILLDAKENAARIIIPIAVQCGYQERNVTVTFRKDLNSRDLPLLIRQMD